MGHSPKKPSGQGSTVARVIIDLDVPHLDRPFDYMIPPDMEPSVKIGSLVRVRWGQKRHNGWVVEVARTSDHDGPLAPLLRVVSAAPLFTERMLGSYRYLSLRFASTLSQVLSLAVPARRAKVEADLSAVEAGGLPRLFADEGAVALRAFYPSTEALLEGNTAVLPRIVAQVPPHLQIGQLRSLLSVCSSRGVPVIVVVPTLAGAKSLYRDLEGAQSPGIALLDYELPATRRYEVHLRALRGEYAAVIGTRTAVWTPFPTPAVIVVWDDGSDHHRERRNPQVDALDVAIARCRFEGYGLIAASFGRSIKAQALVESGWAVELEPDPAALRRQIPKVRVVGEASFEREGLSAISLLPNAAYDLIRRALPEGPVLVQVPGAGRHITIPADHPEIGSGSGSERTLEVGSDRVGRELGRAFPGSRVVVSASSTKIHRKVSAASQIVVATPGAEPSTPEGYAAVIVSEADFQAFAPRMNARDEALSRWFNAFALARPRSVGMLLGDVPAEMSRSLVLWRPSHYARLLLEERREIGFFPARWIVAIEGEPAMVGEYMQAVESAQIDTLTVLGSVSVADPGQDAEDRKDDTDRGPEQDGSGGLFDLPARTRLRSLVSCDPGHAMVLMERLRGITNARSLQRKPPVKVIVNPPELFEGH